MAKVLDLFKILEILINDLEPRIQKKWERPLPGLKETFLYLKKTWIFPMRKLHLLLSCQCCFRLSSPVRNGLIRGLACLLSVWSPCCISDTSSSRQKFRIFANGFASRRPLGATFCTKKANKRNMKLRNILNENLNNLTQTVNQGKYRGGRPML